MHAVSAASTSSVPNSTTVNVISATHQRAARAPIRRLVIAFSLSCPGS